MILATSHIRHYTSSNLEYHAVQRCMDKNLHWNLMGINGATSRSTCFQSWTTAHTWKLAFQSISLFQLVNVRIYCLKKKNHIPSTKIRGKLQWDVIDGLKIFYGVWRNVDICKLHIPNTIGIPIGKYKSSYWQQRGY